MKSPKLIVFDLDGTLLRSDKSISAYTCQMLTKCQRRGLFLAIATARPIRAVKGFIPNLTYDAALYHNGATIHLFGKEIANSRIAIADARAILLAIADDFPNTRLSAEVGDRLYANFDFSDLWPGIVYTHTDFTDLPDVNADKILIGISSPTDVDRFRKYLPDSLYIQSSESAVGMVMSRNASKLIGAQLLCDKLDVTLAHTVFFGDDHNDIELLSASGAGVAVANSIPEAKLAADYICGNNDEDGPAKWLEANILL
ncbi:MAG: HAD family hydrolase [Coriobacteriales bacterium]|jgi:Cof subfamily protein (haloacid dehalogenase superfamily)|nr:HAD family hydrolase [Coriobacteriales bacterium]